MHIQYARDLSRPWAGFGPIQRAALAGRLSAETVKALADESAMPRGGFLPLPVGGDDPTVASLKADIKSLAGEIATVEAGDWGGAAGGGSASWKVERVGAHPPESLVKLASVATAEVYAACGLSPSLFDTADGTSKREGYRQALFGVIAPLGRIVQADADPQAGNGRATRLDRVASGGRGREGAGLPKPRRGRHGHDAGRRCERSAGERVTMSDTCHLPSCDEPRVTMTLCKYHAERLLAPLALRKPRAPADAERREAA